MTRTFLYRRGDGNEGNFPRALVTLEIDGEPENPTAVIYSGPRGESAFDSAWLTAELESVDPADAPDGIQVRGGCYVKATPIREALDKGARAILTNPAFQ